MQQDITVLSQFYKLADWFENNRQKAVMGAIIIAVAAMAVGYYLWSQGEKEVNAGEALSHVLVRSTTVQGAAATAFEGYQKVAQDYAGTKAGGQALLAAGADLFTQGKYDDAMASLQQMVKGYPESPLMAQAQYGIAACLDAEGKTQDALAAYQHVYNGFPSSDVVAQSKFAAASLLEGQGKLTDALTLFEDIARTYRLDTSIGSEAGIRGDEVRRRIATAGTGAPEAPAAVTPSLSPSDFTRSLTNLTTEPAKH